MRSELGTRLSQGEISVEPRVTVADPFLRTLGLEMQARTAQELVPYQPSPLIIAKA